MRNYTISLAAAVILVGSGAKPTHAQNVGTWQSVGTWPDPRAQGAAVADPSTGKIYVFGGYGNAFSIPTNAADVFDPVTHSWAALAPLPTAVRGGSAVIDGGKVYIYSGITASFDAAGIQIYDIASNAWTTLVPEIPFSAFESESTSVGGKHYIQGGEAHPTRFFERDYVAGSMMQLADAPNPHYGHGLLSYGGKIYAFGGLTSPADVGSPVTVANDAYDLNTQTWSTTPADMLTACTAFAVDSDGRYFYVAGGGQTYLNGSQPFLNQFAIYDPDADVWHSGPALPVGLRDPMGVVDDGSFYVLGGIDTGGVSDDIFAVTIPEPASATLVLAGCAAMIFLRRRAKPSPE